MKGADLIKEVENAGWRLDRVRGSHHVFRKEGMRPVVIPHPKKQLGKGIVAAIRKAAGIE
ncbi:MAG TPA: type II toxin-antitoxin system HicA family toxin [Candidatus Luteimonas excrementigallinarum]|nr:type II toxin-antitoxin system HicA family toxin [Candidatus Luteimonas excrementigallinarum]